jgi:D-beta-D-heptose 7-phosphate kinase / D-beta-D-heptose 1-phosphate adenosyltransferase
MTLTFGNAIQHFPAARVCVLGDIMVDSYVEGGVWRISPEAPVPVLHRQAQHQVLGGAANVAANITGLGGQATLLSVTGQDPLAAQLREMATARGIRTLLTEAPARRTSLKTRIMAQRQQLLRIDDEDAGPIDETQASRLLENLEREIGDCRLVVVSDYGKGIVTETVVQGVIRIAAAQGKLVMVDPKGTDYGRYRGASLLTPNLKELGEAVGRPLHGDAEIAAGARQLAARYALQCVVVTRGEHGMSIIRQDSAVHLPTVAREVFDVSGAGDTVVAALALGLCAGLSYEDAAQLGNVAAGIVVGKLGTAVISAAELTRALHDRHLDGEAAARPLVDRERAVAITAAWRAGGERIGFTNGCFDLLHPGHLEVLAKARAHCDRLVVGLNSDASVRRLKGPQRPVNDEATRAAMLAALRSVDLVVLFDEDTPRELIAALQPDLLCKGGDYDRASIVGADIVEARGGEVLTVDLVGGFSTTRLIQRITEAYKPG